MFALVKYVCDGIYSVCQKRNITRIAGSSKAMVKYTNRVIYEADILGFHGSRKVLMDIKRNLEYNNPYVGLFRHDLKSMSIRLKRLDDVESRNSLSSQEENLENTFYFERDNNLTEIDDSDYYGPRLHSHIQ